MKKLLLLLTCLEAFAIASTPSATSNNLAQYAGPFNFESQYIVKNIVGTYYKATPMVTESGNLYIMSGESASTKGLSPQYQSVAWNVLVGESRPSTLANGKVWIGNSGGNPAERTISGAISITNAGVASANQAYYWETNTGSSDNVLTGIEYRYGSAAFGSIESRAESVVTVTYGTPCDTTAGYIALTAMESSIRMPITAKVRSQTVNGFVAAVQNESAIAVSIPGTLLYQTTCN